MDIMSIGISIISLLVAAFIYLCIIALVFAIVKAILTKGKKIKYSKPPVWLLLTSVILGVIITGLYTGQMDFTKSNCGYYEYTGTGEVTYPAEDITCTDLSYGYPQKFVSGHTTVGLTKHLPSKIASNDISAGSEIELNKNALAIDLVVWSTASFLALSVGYFWNSATPKRKKKK